MVIEAPESSGLLDTCVLVDWDRYATSGRLPTYVAISAITLAELSYGVATAGSPIEAVRRARVQAQTQAMFNPLPFDERAALAYGELVALVIAAGRHPRPRRIDLLIGAVAAANEIPLYTANIKGFNGLESALQVIDVRI